MHLALRRQAQVEPALPATALGGARVDDVYVLLADAAPRWQVTIDWGKADHVPFREEALWPAAGVAAIGGGDSVYFVELARGALRQRLDLPCYFGHLALDDGEPGVRAPALYVLGWTDIVMLEPSLETRYWLRDVAVDGVCFVHGDGATLRFDVEMDPPGGWFALTIDAASGRVLAKEPAFLDNYVGLYGRGGA